MRIEWNVIADIILIRKQDLLGHRVMYLKISKKSIKNKIGKTNISSPEHVCGLTVLKEKLHLSLLN